MLRMSWRVYVCELCEYIYVCVSESVIKCLAATQLPHPILMLLLLYQKPPDE